MFKFFKDKLSNIYSSFTSKVSSLFSRTSVDEETLKELEKILIAADTGVQTTRSILNNLREKVKGGQIKEGEDLRQALEQELKTILDVKKPKQNCSVFLLVGVNGSGKTTFAAKLAHRLHQEDKKVLLVAADTFRAAAPEQLTRWAEQTGSDIVLGKPEQDPASVVFTGCQKFNDENYDALIIDTAGRLQTKTNLMKELEKIKKVITKHVDPEKVCTLLTIDSMLGQNSLEQAKLFNESTDLDGIVLTKMDGTGKGGIVFAITQELKIPIHFITYGEQLAQCKEFDAQEYVQQLLSE